MNDILPPDSARWEWFEDKVRALMARYGYANVRTPIVEPTALFVRGLGEVTDIVEKEMYSFEDAMNGDRLTLRPEATAGIVRAMIEHNALYNGPMRLWSTGHAVPPRAAAEGPLPPVPPDRRRGARLRRPGRRRRADPDVPRAAARPRPRRRRDVRLELNSLGQPDERLAHRAALIAHFEAHADVLDDDARRRLHSNPLRILDSKNPAMQAIVEAAPKLMDFLGEASLAHLDAVRAVLDAVGLAYRINPRLVRGMDYYNLTVFEWITDQLGSQGTVCGGGRYDGLFEQLGGKPTPAVGWGMGIERMLLLLEAVGVAMPPSRARCLCDRAGRRRAGRGARDLRGAARRRRAGADARAGADGWGSMKAQFKRADASGARFALVFGADELARGEVALKSLRDAHGAATHAARSPMSAAGRANLRTA